MAARLALDVHRAEWERGKDRLEGGGRDGNADHGHRIGVLTQPPAPRPRRLKRDTTHFAHAVILAV